RSTCRNERSLRCATSAEQGGSSLWFSLFSESPAVRRLDGDFADVHAARPVVDESHERAARLVRIAFQVAEELGCARGAAGAEPTDRKEGRTHGRVARNREATAQNREAPDGGA